MIVKLALFVFLLCLFCVSLVSTDPVQMMWMLPHAAPMNTSSMLWSMYVVSVQSRAG
jgi:hypothetical protein